MLDNDFWTTLAVVISAIGALLTGIANLINALKPKEKKQRTKHPFK